MPRIKYEECLECDGEIPVEEISNEQGLVDYEYPNFCPHCGTDLALYNSVIVDQREDFHSDG
jgi:hypothetical protein